MKSAFLFLLFTAVLLTVASDAAAAPKAGNFLRVINTAKTDAFLEDFINSYNQRFAQGEVVHSSADSAAVLEAVSSATADLGVLSSPLEWVRALPPASGILGESSAQKFYPWKIEIAKYCWAVVVGKDGFDGRLTLQQVKGIFSTDGFRNWKELGGSDQRIYPMVVEGAGLTVLFERSLGMGAPSYKQTELLEILAKNPGAVAVVPLQSMDHDIDPRLRVIPIAEDIRSEYVLPTHENILAGRYPCVAPITVIASRAPKAWRKALISALLSEEGQTVLAEHGFIPVGLSQSELEKIVRMRHVLTRARHLPPSIKRMYEK